MRTRLGGSHYLMIGCDRQNDGTRIACQFRDSAYPLTMRETNRIDPNVTRSFRGLASEASGQHSHIGQATVADETEQVAGHDFDFSQTPITAGW